MAQVDFFLKLDGVDGESTDDKHKGEIDILSFSWGLSNAGTGGFGTGSGAGKVSFQDIHITKYAEKSSPVLALNCASGKHHATATLVARKAGEKPLEYLKIKLTEVLISSYQIGGSHGDSLAQESVTLNFSKIETTYTPQAADGTALGAVVQGWDVKANKKT